MGQKLALSEVEESQVFMEVKHSKYQNGFITMYSLGQEIFDTIFSFQIGWAKTKLLWFEDFGRQPKWKLKGHNRSYQKSKNGFFLMSSLWIIELIETDGIGFGWVNLILSTFEDPPSVSDQGRWRVTRRLLENHKWWKIYGSLIMHFDKSCTWFPILMWFWVEQVLKLSNLTKSLNNQNHAWVMKIRPKTKILNMTSYDRIFILDHEETCLIRFWYVFMRFNWK